MSEWVVACAGVLVSYISSMVITAIYLLLIIAKIPLNEKVVMKEKLTVPTKHRLKLTREKQKSGMEFYSFGTWKYKR